MNGTKHESPHRGVHSPSKAYGSQGNSFGWKNTGMGETKPESGGRGERRYETFVMTGDMIIKTTSPHHKPISPAKKDTKSSDKKVRESPKREIKPPSVKKNKPPPPKESPKKAPSSPSRSRIPKPRSGASTPKHSPKPSPKFSPKRKSGEEVGDVPTKVLQSTPLVDDGDVLPSFPNFPVELDIPPDDISSEDEKYKNDSVGDLEDLPPPPEEFFQVDNRTEGLPNREHGSGQYDTAGDISNGYTVDHENNKMDVETSVSVTNSAASNVDSLCSSPVNQLFDFVQPSAGPTYPTPLNQPVEAPPLRAPPHEPPFPYARPADSERTSDPIDHLFGIVDPSHESGKAKPSRESAYGIEKRAQLAEVDESMDSGYLGHSRTQSVGAPDACSTASDSHLEYSALPPDERPIVVSKSAEKICQHTRSHPNKSRMESPSIVRSSKSHDNYLDRNEAGLSLVDIDLEDTLASSVDALHYDKSSTSIDSLGQKQLSFETSQSVDNSPEKGFSSRIPELRAKPMPTFISVEEPRSIAKLKEGGKLRDFSKRPGEEGLPSKSVQSSTKGGDSSPNDKPPASPTKKTKSDKSKSSSSETGIPSKERQNQTPKKKAKPAGDSVSPQEPEMNAVNLIVTDVTETSTDTEPLPVTGSPARSSAASKIPQSPHRLQASASPKHKADGSGKELKSPTKRAPAPSGTAALAGSPKKEDTRSSDSPRKKKKQQQSPAHIPIQTNSSGADQITTQDTKTEAPEAGLDLSEPAQGDYEPVETGSNQSSPEDMSPAELEGAGLYHQPMKEVDRPSAYRLAKRLYNQQGFKKTDISRHLCKK